MQQILGINIKIYSLQMLIKTFNLVRVLLNCFVTLLRLYSISDRSLSIENWRKSKYSE